ATFVESGDDAAERVRAIAPDGADLVIDLVGGQPLREIAPVAKDPAMILSTADQGTAQKLGGAGVQRTKDGLEKIASVAGYGLVDADGAQRIILDEAQQAIAAVEYGHAAGKVVIEP